MTFCPECGNSKVKKTGGDSREYPHPTAQGVIEKFIMFLCEKCGWSWNCAGAKQVAR